MEQIVKNCRKIVITGGVAVGKTSVIDIVKNELTKLGISWKLIPEYIDAKEDALEMLNKYLQKQITSYEFQCYVLDYYDWYFSSQIDIKPNDVLLFERVLDDSVICFSNLDNHKDELSDEEFVKVFNKAMTINKKYNIPSYFTNKDFIFVPIKTIQSDLDALIISSIVQRRPKENIIIGLYNTDKTCYERMLKRNRQGETDVYTLNYIHKFNKTYNKLYRHLMTEDKIIFADIGKFI